MIRKTCACCSREIEDRMFVYNDSLGLVYCDQQCEQKDLEYRKGPRPCMTCGEITHKDVFCSRECRDGHVRLAKMEAWLKGEYHVKKIAPWMRSYLKNRLGSKCSQCGWDQYHADGISLTQIDHINGDPKDSRIENLRILCPNCHSMTETYGGRNIKKRRKTPPRYLTPPF